MIEPMQENQLLQGLLDHEAEPVKAILGAAECCFWGKGYEAASMREIAEAAKVSKSLLHYYFRSKEHLFLEVQIRVCNRLAARLAEAVEGETTSERGLFALDTAFQVLRKEGELPVQAEIWARALSNDRMRSHVVRLREHLRKLMIRTIERILGPAAASLPFGLEAAADLVWATFWGLGLQNAFDEDPGRVERAFDAFRRIAAAVLAPGAK